MGKEQLQMIELNKWANGEPFVGRIQASSVNQAGLGRALNLADTMRRNNQEHILGAAREFRRFLEEQIGEREDFGMSSTRSGGAGLYALHPVKAGYVRAECRTTSHDKLHKAYLGAGLWATRERELDKYAGDVWKELRAVRSACLDMLHQELSWSHICWVDASFKNESNEEVQIGVLAPARRHRKGSNHELMMVSADRNAWYRLASGLNPKLPEDVEFERKARKDQNVQQLGYRLFHRLFMQRDQGVIDVFAKLRGGELQLPRFWDGMKVARWGDGTLIAWVENMQRKGRDDTSYVRWSPGTSFGIDDDPTFTAKVLSGDPLDIQIFLRHDEETSDG